jgi:hypothetical protein
MATAVFPKRWIIFNILRGSLPKAEVVHILLLLFLLLCRCYRVKKIFYIPPVLVVLRRTTKPDRSIRHCYLSIF